MDPPNHTQTTCCCNKPTPDIPGPAASPVKKTTRTLSSVCLSVLIAFFPKCPMCWAAYMSLFGSIGIAQLPYMGWLLPVLIGFLLIHLFMLYKKAAGNSYVPFFLSLAGAVTMLLARMVFPHEKWMLITAVSLIITGSLLNSFSHNIPLSFTHKHQQGS